MATTTERVRLTREQREELAHLMLEAMNRTRECEASAQGYMNGRKSLEDHTAARQQYDDHIRAIWRRFYEVTG
jgi:hypothetical protein